MSSTANHPDHRPRHADGIRGSRTSNGGRTYQVSPHRQVVPQAGQLLTPENVADLTWEIQTSGDFNGDGWVDLIWQNNRDGRIAVWFMHNTQISGEVFATIAPSTWAIKGAGDLDGDGWPDLLWQHLNSSMGVWYMNGLVMTQGLPFVLDHSGFRIAAPK